MSKTTLIALTSLACGSLVSLAADQSSSKTYSYSSSSSSSTNGMNGDTDSQGYWKPKVDKNNNKNYHNYVITPHVGPVGWFMTADFIWWKPYLEDTQFATSGFTPPGTTISASKGKVREPNYKWEPGFKVGLGYIFDHDGWDLNLEYTWLNMSHDNGGCNGEKGRSISSSSSSAVMTDYDIYSANQHDCFCPTTGTATVPSPLSVVRASGRAKIFFSALDLELGRNYWISKYLTLRPFAGLKSAWISNKHSVNYDLDETCCIEGGTFTDCEDFSGNTDHLSLRQTMWGIGIRVGMDAAWHFNKAWSIYGDWALSGLWTSFNSKRKDTWTTDTGVKYVALNTRSPNIHTIEPVLELGLGFMYQAWFHDNDYELDVKLGWEEQVWWNHNQFVNVVGHRHGNLTLQGLTLEVGFHF